MNFIARRVTLYLLYSLILVVLYSESGCSEAQPICTNQVNGTSVETNNRPCQSDCDCSNQAYQGFCAPDGVCVSVPRESCEGRNSGVEDTCSLDKRIVGFAKDNCPQRTRICKERGLSSKVWGNCKCPNSSQETSPELPYEIAVESSSEAIDETTKEVASEMKSEPETVDETDTEQSLEHVTSDAGQEPTPESSSEESPSDASVCTSSQTRPCFPKNTAGCVLGSNQKYTCKGLCKPGTESCTNGKWSGVCNNAVKPTIEACNDKDDNCDGQVDEHPTTLNSCGGQMICCTGKCASKAVRWQFASQVDSLNNDYGYDIAVDKQGNTYVVGAFSGSARFGTTTLTTTQSKTAYVAKLDNTGKWLWAVPLGGGHSEGFGIQIDNKDDVVVTGILHTQTIVSSTTLSVTGTYDLFVGKLNPSGQWRWLKQADISDKGFGYKLAVDTSNFIYIAGRLEGSIKVSGVTTTSNGATALIAKMDSSGNWLWASHANGTTGDARDIAIDPNGNVFVTGHFSGKTGYGTVTLDAAGKLDIYVAKLNSAGSFQWAIRAGGPSDDEGFSVAVGPLGNVFVAGYFANKGTFGSITLNSASSNDGYVGKLDTNGKWLWVKHARGSAFNVVREVATNNQGQAYIVGTFAGGSSGNVTLGTTTLTSNKTDLFVAKLDSFGQWLWAEQFGSAAVDNVRSVFVGSGGEVYVTGRIESQMTLGSTTLPHKGGADAYVAALSSGYRLCPTPPHQIALGNNHACMIFEDNKVKCWGDNTLGQLGYGDQKERLKPAEASVNLGSNRTALQVAIGQGFTCAILDNQTVKCWGDNSGGQLGYGDKARRTTPDSKPIALLKNAKNVTLGSNFGCALLADGTVKCWGVNALGQLGYGDKNPRTKPDTKPIDFGPNRTVRQLSAGDAHVCAILDNEQVKCWGHNSSGQLGYGDLTPRAEPGSTTIALGSGRSAKQISAGSNHTCAILDNYTVKCWGANNKGQLGYKDTTPRSKPSSQSISFDSGRTVKQIVAGNTMTCAILDDGSARCWGGNQEGQLGYGDSQQREEPDSRAINLGPGRTVKQIITQGAQVCALLDDDSLKCWGKNPDGRLGYGDKTARKKPDSLPIQF